MKVTNQIKIIIGMFFTIAPIIALVDKKLIKEYTGFNTALIQEPTVEQNRREIIRRIAHDIVQLTEQIDQTMQLRELLSQQHQTVKILKDIDALKRLRDAKIQELHNLRQ